MAQIALDVLGQSACLWRLSGMPGTPCPSSRWLWRLPLTLRRPVSNDLLSVRTLRPDTRCSMRLSTTLGSAVGGDPISPTASFTRPGHATGRLRQHQGRGCTRRLDAAHASFSAAPSGTTPVFRKRHRAMSHLRATATIPMRLRRVPPPPKRSRNQQLRALCG